MNHPDEELRKAVALFRYGLIADVLRVPLGSREIRRTLREKAQRSYTIPGTRRTRVAVETMRDWLSLYRTGGFDALYPKTRADRGHPRARGGGSIGRSANGVGATGIFRCRSSTQRSRDAWSDTSTTSE